MDRVELTPIERHGDIWVKRDDLYTFAGVPGGKVRSCLSLAYRAKKEGARGLITACSRHSPQGNIVARVGRELGLQVRVHIPYGAETAEMAAAAAAGAKFEQHKPGYNSVLIHRAEQDAALHPDWAEIPFGMKCREAVNETAKQTMSFAQMASKEVFTPDFGGLCGEWDRIKRIVVPVGSGISLCGILVGMARMGLYGGVYDPKPILAVQVGADPLDTIRQYAPFGTMANVRLIQAGHQYHDAVDAQIGSITLDPHYEAKCHTFLEPGDLFWIVGIRQTGVQR